MANQTSSPTFWESFSRFELTLILSFLDLVQRSLLLVVQVQVLIQAVLLLRLLRLFLLVLLAIVVLSTKVPSVD